ncbi:MAG: GNAT family N-acetyltransferase [Capsulimonadales bacterium]|nr:GNAT family N-acetyltransferase [Capsulimonadales bacterium]
MSPSKPENAESPVTRPLTEAEALRLSLALRDTPNILGYLPGELTGFSDALVVESTTDGTLAGVCLIKRLPMNWADLAVLYVFPEHRNRGIGTRLFRDAFARLRTERRHILCVSREPSVLRRMEAERMRFIGSWQLPLPVQWAYSRHYMSSYRFREAFRKQAVFPKQPPFRYAVLRAET